MPIVTDRLTLGGLQLEAQKTPADEIRPELVMSLSITMFILTAEPWKKRLKLLLLMFFWEQQPRWDGICFQDFLQDLMRVC